MKFWPFMVLGLLLLMAAPALASDTYMGFVTHQATNTVSVFDPSSMAVITTFSTDTSPRCVFVNPSGTYVYVASASSFTVTVYRTSDYLKVATITTATSPYSITSNADGSKIYIADIGTKIYVIDSATNTISKTITSTSSGYGHAYRYEDKIYLTKKAASKVVVIDTTTDTISTYINVGASPENVVGNTILEKIYVANSGSTTLSVIDPASDTVTATIDLGASSPWGMCIKSDGSVLYVTCSWADNIKVVNTATDTVTTTIAVGDLPRGCAIEENNQYVYVANYNNTNITVISTASNTITESISLSYSSPDYIFISKIAPGPTPSELEVTFNVNKGGIVNVADVSVSVYDAITNNFINSDTTDDAGNAIFILTTGKRYTLEITGNGVSLTQTIQVQPNDAYYYIDVCTGEILGSTQYSTLYKLHSCTLYVYNWGTPEKYANLQLYKNGTLIKNATTDTSGGAAYYVQSDVLYTIRVYNTTKSIDKNFSEYLNVDKKTLDLWIISIPGWTYNESTLNQSSPQSIYTNGSVKPRTAGADTFIDCSYNDTGSLTTSVNYTLYVSENGNLTQLDTHTNAGSYGSDTHSFQVTSPTGKDYTVKIEAKQSTGTITMWFYYHWPGPMVNIPGLPLDWYKYVSLVIIGGIALGTASRINVSFVAATMTIAALWLNNVMGWMFEIPGAPVLIFFMIIVSIVMFWTQKSKGEV